MILKDIHVVEVIIKRLGIFETEEPILNQLSGDDIKLWNVNHQSKQELGVERKNKLEHGQVNDNLQSVNGTPKKLQRWRPAYWLNKIGLTLKCLLPNFQSLKIAKKYWLFLNFLRVNQVLLKLKALTKGGD